MLWMGLTGVRPWADRLQAHDAHQSLNSLAPNQDPITTQLTNHLPRAIKWTLGVNLIDASL
jgi:hypothetical protein